MRLIVVRHGETVLNTEHRVAGRAATRLTELGLAQAERLGSRLASEDISKIYSSDLERARQTTEQIVRFVPVPVEYDERLRERDWGQLEGVLQKDYRAAIAESGRPYHEFKPEGGESLVDLRERVAPFISKILERHGGETVVISAHHSVNKTILFLILNKTWEEWPGFSQHNTCVNILELAPSGRMEAVLLNCVTHLDGLFA